MPKPSRPTRRAGESNENYQRRLASWVSQIGMGAPTTPAPPPADPAPSPAPGYSPGEFVEPQPGDYWFAIDTDVNSPTYMEQIRVPEGTPGAWHETGLYNEDLAAYREGMRGPEADTYHPPAWRPGELELEKRGFGLEEQQFGLQERQFGLDEQTLAATLQATAEASRIADIEARQAAETQEATNMVNYLDAVAKGIELEISAGTLSLAQGAEEFDRRLDAFAEAGAQMSNLWKWTVPKGSAGQPLHADIREGLGMRPWVSEPTEYDPVGEAQKIISSMPPMAPVPSTDPYSEMLEMAKGLIG